MRCGLSGVPSVASVRFAVGDIPAQAKRAVSGWPTRVGPGRRPSPQYRGWPRTVLTGVHGMAYHNPFIDKNGQIKFPDNTDLVRHVEKWARVRGDQLAYRFLAFSTEREGVAKDISWAEFGARNRAVGARLQQVTQPGDRGAILCPQNLDYLTAVFGTLYAARIAVPLFDPAEPGHVGRLHAVLDDCTPAAILTTSDSAEGVRKFFRSRPAKERPRVIAVDAVPNDVASTWEPVLATSGTVAYLQYTSGSTRTPTGVQISHLNLPTNVLQTLVSLEGAEGDRGLSWLPLFHDMGLITALCAPVLGQSFTFMTPAAFVRRPGRWIRELARKPGETGGGCAGAPHLPFPHAPGAGPTPPPRPRPAPGPEHRQGHPQRQRAGVARLDAQVLRGVRAVRPEGDRRQAVLRPGRGDAVRLDHADEPEAQGHPRRPQRAEQPALRRGGPGRAQRRRPGVGGQGRRRRVGCHRRPGIGRRAAGRADRRDLAARQEPGARLLGEGAGVDRHL